MPEWTQLAVYLSAALILAITPGPGIFYVLTRSLKGGRSEGYASAVGTAIGGLFHVIAAAVGLSAILMTSALAFSIVKYAGAAYLVYLGVRTILERNAAFTDEAETPSKGKRALYQGILTEVLNPKTALFFLAFIPQFINPDGAIVAQFVILGSISVFLNTSVDVIVATLAGPIGYQLKTRSRLRKGQQMFTGASLIALGAYVAFAGGEQAE
ncbi:MAG: LysE family translocator [Anaerolineae bacterium]|nr:LysE family translocator [Anaerolineae bacterium]